MDSFAVVKPGTGVAYRWLVDLDDRERSILDRLVTALPYLGRAESVCDAALSSNDAERAWHQALPDAEGRGTRTLVPTQPLDLDELCVSIRDMRKGRRLFPPGAQWVRYDVPPAIDRPMRRRATPVVRRVEAARFALTRAAPISVHHTVTVAELMRASAMSHFGRLFAGAACETLAGKWASGQPLRGHPHAHWLPFDLDRDRLLDTILVWAPGGLSADDITALAAIRELRFHGGDGMGSTEPAGVALEAIGPLSELGGGFVWAMPSATWRSATPFLPQRHRKRQGVDEFLRDCVERELHGARRRDPLRGAAVGYRVVGLVPPPTKRRTHGRRTAGLRAGAALCRTSFAG